MYDLNGILGEGLHPLMKQSVLVQKTQEFCLETRTMESQSCQNQSQVIYQPSTWHHALVIREGPGPQVLAMTCQRPCHKLAVEKKLEGTKFLRKSRTCFNC